MVQTNLSTACSSVLPIIHYLSSTTCWNGFPSVIRNVWTCSSAPEAQLLWCQRLVSFCRNACQTLASVFFVMFCNVLLSENALDKNKASGRLNKGIPVVPPQRGSSEHDAFRCSLPVQEHKQEIIKLIRENRVVLVVGATGSGKTTQVGHFGEQWSDLWHTANVQRVNPQTMTLSNPFRVDRKCMETS